MKLIFFHGPFSVQHTADRPAFHLWAVEEDRAREKEKANGKNCWSESVYQDRSRGDSGVKGEVLGEEGNEEKHGVGNMNTDWVRKRNVVGSEIRAEKQISG